MNQEERECGEKERLETLIHPLLKWYDENARDLPWRRTPEPYKVWISEIMLQQTRVEAGREYFLRWVKELPDVQALANVPDEKLMKLWEGLGYYNRARNLKRAAGIIMEQYGGDMPSTYEGLLSLPGIGPYTAGAVGSIAFGLPMPAVDGNVLRVLARLLASSDDIALPATKKRMEALLKETMPEERCGDFNQALMELGALICIPNGEPKCDLCPAWELCLAREQELIGKLPVKAGKKARRIEKRTVLLLQQNGRILLHRRKNEGLLAGLWELPNHQGSLTKKEAAEWAKDLLGRAAAEGELLARELPPAKHIFSHVEWHMEGYEMDVQTSYDAFSVGESGMAYSRATLKEPPEYTWASKQDLEEKYSLPSAFQPYRQRFFSAK